MKWKYRPQVGGTAYIDLLVPGNRPFATVGHMISLLPPPLKCNTWDFVNTRNGKKKNKVQWQFRSQKC